MAGMCVWDTALHQHYISITSVTIKNNNLCFFAWKFNYFRSAIRVTEPMTRIFCSVCDDQSYASGLDSYSSRTYCFGSMTPLFPREYVSLVGEIQRFDIILNCKYIGAWSVFDRRTPNQAFLNMVQRLSGVCRKFCLVYNNVGCSRLTIIYPL